MTLSWKEEAVAICKWRDWNDVALARPRYDVHVKYICISWLCYNARELELRMVLWGFTTGALPEILWRSDMNSPRCSVEFFSDGMENKDRSQICSGKFILVFEDLS